MEFLNGKKTYIGIAVIVLVEVLRLFGLSIGVDAVTLAALLAAFGIEPGAAGQETAASIVALIGAALAAYGRFVAKPKGD